MAVNPNDTEEAVWAFLCDAQVSGFDAARAAMLSVGRDSRSVMRTVYELFRGTTPLDKVTPRNGEGVQASWGTENRSCSSNGRVKP